MDLSFSERWPKHMPAHLAGQPTNFIEKVYEGLFTNYLAEPMDYVEHHWAYLEKFNRKWDSAESPMSFLPKMHTIREDKHNRWKPGIKIHPVINSRTKDRFQFAPTLLCVSVQEVVIEWVNGWFTICVDGRPLNLADKARISFNDGFDSIEHFKSWFSKDFSGKIIHWTDLKY